MTDNVGEGTVELDREFLPLKLLGHVLTALVASEIALATARLVVPLLDRGDTPFQAEIDIKPVVVLPRVAFPMTVILFLIWFRRARINAERCGWRQRRARAWVFWGWVIPIANLWIPFQVMGDIWRAGLLPPERRSKIAWLPALWWTSWLLTEPLSPISINTPSSRPTSGLPLPRNWLSLSLLAITGMALIAIIQIVSSGPVGVGEVQQRTATEGILSNGSLAKTCR